MWFIAIIIVVAIVIYLWKSDKFSYSEKTNDTIDWDFYNKLICQTSAWLDERELLPFDVIGITVRETSYAKGNLSVGFNYMYSSTSLWRNYPYPDPNGRPGNQELAQACDETMKKVNELFTKHPAADSYESKPFGTYSKSNVNNLKAKIEEYNEQHFPNIDIRITTL